VQVRTSYVGITGLSNKNRLINKLTTYGPPLCTHSIQNHCGPFPHTDIEKDSTGQDTLENIYTTSYFA